MYTNDLLSGGNAAIESLIFVGSQALIITVIQGVVDVGLSLKDINLTSLKLHQIGKKLDKVLINQETQMFNALKQAVESFDTALNERQAELHSDAKETFDFVIKKADEGLKNLEVGSLDLETFKLCQVALLLQMISLIANYCYHDDQNPRLQTFIDYNYITKKKQKLIAKELEKLTIKAISLKEKVKLKDHVMTTKKEQRSRKEDSQNILNKFLQFCYPYISNGFGWTRMESKIKSGNVLKAPSNIKIQVKTAYLPDGEEDKSCIQVGIMEDTKETIAVHVWVSEQKLYIQHQEKLVLVTKIDTDSDLMEVKFSLEFSVVISSSGGAAQFCGDYLGQYNYAGEHNGRPYYRQLHTVGSEVIGYLYSGDSNNNHWYVGCELGNTENYRLYNPDASDTPPTTGWKYRHDRKPFGWNYGGKLFHDDPTLKISPGVLQPCDVTVKLSGDVLSKYPEYAGEYHHNGEYCYGRAVYTNNNSKLLYQYYGVWCVGDSTGGRGKIWSKLGVDGGGAPNCPSMVSQWRCDGTDTTHIKISRNTNH